MIKDGKVYRFYPYEVGPNKILIPLRELPVLDYPEQARNMITSLPLHLSARHIEYHQEEDKKDAWHAVLSSVN